MLGCLVEFFKITALITRKKLSLLMLLAIPYIVLPLSRLIYLGNYSLQGELVFSPLIPAGIIFSIWINDTGAYIIGSLIGKTPLTIISPKKTWEGTIGGILLSTIIVTILGCIINNAKILEWYQWTSIAAICGIFGTLGDLLESKIKRTAEIKDSGNIMPGHGGFLDRFDSLLIATPIVWVYIKLFL
jgi:phosphatidate cytidylyltransferase